MNRKHAVLFAAVLATGTAFADDITIDPHPFTSTASRAQVQQEFREYRQAGVNPWAQNYDHLRGFVSTASRADVTAGFLASRADVAALSAEDSGSAMLSRLAASKTRRTVTEMAIAK